LCKSSGRLEFEPSDEMAVCDACKAQMVQFYNFKIKAEKVRNNLNENTAELTLKEEIQDEAVVCNTVQIVRSYIAKHSITEIRVEQSLQRLIISP